VRLKIDFGRRFKSIRAISSVVARNPLVPSGKSSLRVCAVLAREEAYARSPRTLVKDAMDALVSPGERC
jgi:hypothetical protein